VLDCSGSIQTVFKLSPDDGRNDGHAVCCSGSLLGKKLFIHAYPNSTTNFSTSVALLLTLSSCAVRSFCAPVLHMYLYSVYHNLLPQKLPVAPSVSGGIIPCCIHSDFRHSGGQLYSSVCLSQLLRPLMLGSPYTLVVHTAFTSFYHELSNPRTMPNNSPLALPPCLLMCITMLGSAGPNITVSRMDSLVVLHLTVGA